MTPDTKSIDARVEAMAVELSHIVRGQRVLLSGRERTVEDIARAILAADAASAQQAALMFNGLTEAETTQSASVAGLQAAPSDDVGTWQGFADADKYKALAESASQAAPSGEAVAWLVLDKNGLLMHAAAWREAAHEHINDAINEHGLTEAAQWVVRPAYTHPAPAPGNEEKKHG